MRPFETTAANLRLAQAAMGQYETKVGESCAELGVSGQTLYSHVDPKGALRPDRDKFIRSRAGQSCPEAPAAVQSPAQASA